MCESDKEIFDWVARFIAMADERFSWRAFCAAVDYIVSWG